MKKYLSYTVGRDGVIRNRFGKVMKTYNSAKGYEIIQLRHNGKAVGKSVHRLLGELFIPNPDNLSDIDHIDGDRRNNSLDNLRWLSHGENIKHSYDSGRRSARGEGNARAILTESDVHDICYLLGRGTTLATFKNMGYPYNSVSAIKCRRNWKYISDGYLF